MGLEGWESDSFQVLKMEKRRSKEVAHFLSNTPFSFTCQMENLRKLRCLLLCFEASQGLRISLNEFESVDLEAATCRIMKWCQGCNSASFPQNSLARLWGLNIMSVVSEDLKCHQRWRKDQLGFFIERQKIHFDQEHFIKSAY